MPKTIAYLHSQFHQGPIRRCISQISDAVLHLIRRQSRLPLALPAPQFTLHKVNKGPHQGRPQLIQAHKNW